MRAHYLQHVPFEGLGSIERWLDEAGYTITGTQFFRPFSLPDISKVDMLIVLGGPMSVNDKHRHPWLVPEKLFIQNYLISEKPALGICLGAQLIANALGAKVYKNIEKEIGWFPIKRIPTNSNKVFSFPEEIKVFHWHGETFELPPNAILLASSEACNNQAFQAGDSVIGLQFHLETTTDSVVDIIENCREELVSAKYIQTEPQLFKGSEVNQQMINTLMAELLYFLTNENK